MVTRAVEWWVDKLAASWTSDAIFMSALLALAVLSLAVAAWIVRIEAFQK